MKYKISIIILLLAIIVPETVSAVWWNPLSWVNKKSSPETEICINDSSTGSNSKCKSETSKKTPDSLENTDIKDTEVTPKISEKIIERTITVDNPELQKKINSLLQENVALQSRISSLTSSLNACNEYKTKKEVSSDEFSDFKFSYILGTNKITFPFNTSRDIVIKKAVFTIKNRSSRDTREIGPIQRLELSTSTGSKPVFYNLENNGSTFTYISSGGILLKGKETLVTNVTVAGNEKETFNIIPVFSEWEIWDNTTDKAVLID